MVDVIAHGARLQLHAGGAQHAAGAIGLERADEIARKLRHHVREADRVLERHARALRHVLQHRVRGVAEQRHAPVHPVLDRVAVAQHPVSPLVAGVNDFSRLLVHVREPRLQRSPLPQHERRLGRRQIRVVQRAFADDHRHVPVESLSMPYLRK